MTTISSEDLTDLWDQYSFLKNLQLLKSKVDLLEPTDSKDQLLLEIEKLQSGLCLLGADGDTTRQRGKRIVTKVGSTRTTEDFPSSEARFDNALAGLEI
jgi:hypothetical protein